MNADHTLIIFWATWCPYCQQLLPDMFMYLTDKTTVKVIAIGLDEDDKAWEDVIKKFPGWIHLRAAEKWNNEWVKLYGVSATPVIYMIDKYHKIHQKIKNLEDLKEVLEN